MSITRVRRASAKSWRADEDALDDPVLVREAKLLMQADADTRDTRNGVLAMLQRRADRWS